MRFKIALQSVATVLPIPSGHGRDCDVDHRHGGRLAARLLACAAVATLGLRTARVSAVYERDDRLQVSEAAAPPTHE